MGLIHRWSWNKERLFPELTWFLKGKVHFKCSSLNRGDEQVWGKQSKITLMVDR